MSRFAFGRFTLDVARRELLDGDDAITVQPQVFDVLAHLVEHADRVVTKEELLDGVWGTRFVTESALTTRIKEARQAVGDDGQRQEMIRTLHGRGYRFLPDVSRLDAGEPATAAAAETASEPPAHELRFCTTDDGVRLAYAQMGDGPPLVKVANWLSHLDYDRETPVWRHWLVELSRRFRLVRYDERGCGLSDWDVPDFSFESWVRDLGAVVDAVGLSRFPLLGLSQGGPVAVAYAARYPERVSHLVLHGAFVQGRLRRARTDEERELAQMRIDIARLGWAKPDPTYRQVFLSRFLPEGTQEEWRVFDELQKRSTSTENAVRFLETFADIDVTEEAPKVQAPTIVVGVRHEPDDMFEQSRILASLIPNARLVSLDSSNHLLPERDPGWRQFLAALDEFLPSAAPA
jgi:pimeloyl-ACP methyl ester carboxylesterase/DNA-binding winged helix-turn-helix (wHTH) protein